MKIAVVPTIREWPWGAPGACMGALVEKLLLHGHEVLWFVAPLDLAHPEVARLEAKGASVVPLPDMAPNYVRLSAIRRRVHGVFAAGPGLRRRMDDFSPDHVFVNQGGAWSALDDGDLFQCLAARRSRYSLIVHLNEPRHPFSPSRAQRARMLFSGARRVFFNSRWVRSLSELQICSTIAHAGFFQPPLRHAVDEPLPWPVNPIPRLAMVCRLDSHHKGIDVSLAAVARLKADGIALRLGIYGDGPDRDYLLALAGFLGVADCVVFHGHREDVRQIWVEEELLLLPSRFEGLGVSMLEAMNFGRPVLRTPYGGASEWIEDGINGYICPAPEVNLLHDSLVRALADRPQWRERGSCAHAKVRRDLDADPAAVFLGALSE